MTEYPPFDPGNPADAIADMFRRQIAEIAVEVGRSPLYQMLTPRQQLESFMGGAIVGVVGVLFAHVTPEAHGEVIKAIQKYLPQARAQAEGIMANSDT